MEVEARDPIHTNTIIIVGICNNNKLIIINRYCSNNNIGIVTIHRYCNNNTIII